jgi:hypothetical protein
LYHKPPKTTDIGNDEGYRIINQRQVELLRGLSVLASLLPVPPRDYRGIAFSAAPRDN